MAFDFLEHTADVRVACRASDMPGLLKSAADALYAVALHSRLEAKTVERYVSLEVSSREELVVRWLQELLFLLDTDRFVAVEVWWQPEVHWISHELKPRGRIKGYICETPDRAEEIKAITYHGLEVRETSEGYYAEIIFDI